MNRRLILLVCLVLSLMSFSACKREPAVDYVVASPFGMPPVMWGMTSEQIQAALGPAEDIKPQSNGRILLLSYLSRGFTLTVDQKRGLVWITCSDVEIGLAFSWKARSFKGKTAEGIGLGATEDAIIAAYGQPTERSTNGEMTYLTYGRMDKSFTLSRGKLWQFSVQAPQLRPAPAALLPSTSSAL
jgi:hypothetical protein